ncbi:MAG: hypothetical protein AB8I58_01255, partial [Anaerolineales bacterium]
MNKPPLFILTLLILILTARSASNGPQLASASSNDALPIETELVVGTLQLEGTEQAVTSEQAQELLPMWQVYQDISNSSTAAQAEVDGLIEQIQETMGTGQMKAITAMNLTQQDVFAAIQAQNITASSGGGGQSSNSGGVISGPPGGGPPDAGMGGGALPDGGMGDVAGMGGADPGTSTGENQDTAASPGLGISAGVPTVLIDALIQYLEQITSS